MSEPLVSIIMPTYNQSRWLPAALASIEAQTFRDFELIVVDDGSTDETPAILDAAQTRAELTEEVMNEGPLRTICWRREANSGAPAAINYGVDLAEGRYLTWVSSDNEMRPEWLETLLVAIGGLCECGHEPSRHYGDGYASVGCEAAGCNCGGCDLAPENVGATYGGFTWQRPGDPGHYLFEPYAPEKLIGNPDCYIGPAFLIRADVWRAAGEHRGKISHDYDHWLRVEEVCWRRGLEIVGVDRDLCIYNAHSERATETRAAEYDARDWQRVARQRRGM